MYSLSTYQLPLLLLLCGALGISPPGATEISVAIPDSGNKLAVLLAENYSPSVHLPDYLVSEKLDGVRAIWDGKTLRFRSGQLIHAPSWFIAALPTHALDGELWMGRGNFDRVSGATRRLVPLEAEWRKMTYQIYELPGGSGSFRERVDRLMKSIASAGVPWLNVVDQFVVEDDQALQLKLRQITDAKGEGLMLHRADAVWQTGRSDVLLKLKTYMDAEATVVGYLKGKGKYQRVVGALLVEMPDGKRFQLGTGLSDVQRNLPPEIGSIVTYRYRDLTPQGLPRFASFLRMYEERFYSLIIPYHATNHGYHKSKEFP